MQRRGCASAEGGGELVVVVRPPAAPALVALAAAGPVPHRDGVRVIGVDASADCCFDAVDGIGRLWEVIAKLLPPSTSRVRDVGCGVGALTLEAARAGHEVTGIDPDPGALAIAAQ